MSLVCFPTMYCKPGKVSALAEAMPLQDCLHKQPKTLAYYFFALHKSPDQIVGFELYDGKAGLKEHGSASSFAAFSKVSGPLMTKPFSLELAAPICGFTSKDGETAENIMENTSCVCVRVSIQCNSAEHRTKLLELAQQIIPTVEAEEGTLTYHWSADTKDLSRVYVFERYRDGDAIKTHTKNTKQFLKDTKDLIASSTIEVGSPVGGYLKKPADSTQNNSSSGTVVPAPPGTRPSVANAVDLSFTHARNGIPQSIAHRGYKSLFPENTLIALEGALRCGAEGIETDVHLSRDGVVVIAHDADTLRCYAKPGNVWEKDYLGPGGMQSYVTVDEPHTHMPTLADVLTLMTQPEWSDKWVLLDIKVDNQYEIIEAMRDTMLAVHPSLAFWARRVVLGVWHHKYLPACAQFMPQIGITHIGLHTSYARRYFLDCDAVQSFNLQLYSLVTKSQQDFVKLARSRGKATYVWTVNDAMAMRYCTKLGVDAILSDDPSKTRAVQNEDLSRWQVTEYWTFKRRIRGYAFNLLLLVMMVHRIFWKFRTPRRQAYVKPKNLIHKSE